MSDNRSDQRAVLNWRGPLLAAAVFASVFGILLLMAHLNQSKTSDEGSSFRQDPYGTSLLFDSYERAGYKVKRSQDENSLADQDATRTTAFFIGGYDYGDVETRDGKIVEAANSMACWRTFSAVAAVQSCCNASPASVSLQFLSLKAIQSLAA